MTHKRYLLDQVWDEEAGNRKVSTEALFPLLQWVQRGRAATLLCYGQTGTGKTHTLLGMLEFLVEQFGAGFEEVEAQFFEIRGKKIHDLFCDRAEVHLNADAEGRFHLRGAIRLQIGQAHGGADVLRQTVTRALELRTSEATERNPLSSRSHAVLLIRFKQKGGILRLVDLAGSERNYETEQMSAAQHKESALINKSLMALKDCFRAHAAFNRGDTKARMPIRADRLTQCLRDCFEDPDHRFLIIATVSPMSSDVIHTMNTLNHAVMMAQALEEATTEVRLKLPLGSGFVNRLNVRMAEWTAKEVAEWVATVENGRFAQLVLPPGLNGESLLMLSKQRLSTLFERTMRTARGEGEGLAWNINGYEEGQGSGERLGKALFAAVRQEALAAVRRCNYPVL